MLSERAKVQIEYMKQFRHRPTDHQHAIETILTPIRSGDIERSSEVRDLCQTLGWYRNSIEDLCHTIDDVCLTLRATGTIERW
jgi:hypothetical protein